MRRRWHAARPAADTSVRYWQRSTRRATSTSTVPQIAAPLHGAREILSRTCAAADWDRKDRSPRLDRR